MNLNKLLCKYFDRDRKGYVTMGNLITAASVLTSLLIIVVGYVRGMTTIVDDWDGNILTSLTAALNAVDIIGAMCISLALVGTGVLLTIIISVAGALLWIAVENVWAVKIVECERKDEDETS